MSRVLLFSDLHIHPHKKRVERLNDCLKCLDWIFETSIKENIEDVIFGGDLFHDRKSIEVLTYYKTFEVMEKWLLKHNIRLWLLLGNHDLWYNEKTTVNSVMPLSALPGVKVISKPERINIGGSNWDFIPFTHNPINTIEELKTFPGDPKYAIGHIAIDGALLHGNTFSDVVIEHDGDMVKVDSKLFSHYDKVFLGHYHAEQKITDSIEYIGSPLELSFGEAYQQKHIIILDQDTGDKTYVKNNFSPKHFMINQSEINDYNLENNFVKIMVDDITSSEIVEMKDEITKNNKLGSLEIKQKKKKIGKEVIQDATSILNSGDEVLEEWIKKNPLAGLNKDKLLKIGQVICQSNN